MSLNPQMLGGGKCSLALTVALLFAAIGRVRAGGDVVFHLDFSSWKDVSGNDLAIEVGTAVSLVPGGGPVLANGATLNSGAWEGDEDDSNQILILDNPILDAVSVSAGSIVAWIKPEDGDEWNNIAKTPCPPDFGEPCDEFSQFVGIEFQASGPHAGVFGAVQGWDTNVFGPDTPLGPGGETDTPSGQWTHAALTWNEDGDHTIYVNGEPGDTVFGVGADDFGLNTPGDWTIGGDNLGANPENSDTSRYLRGELADFAIFSGTLTEAEIREIIQSGVPSASSPGDFNRNGELDLEDVNLLSSAIAAGTHDPAFDLAGDGMVDGQDLQIWVKDLKNTWFGDANLDGEFNSADFVAVFQADKFEKGVPATWETGDWTADLRFDSADFVRAFQDSGFEMGPRGAAEAVPEPASFIVLLIGSLFLCGLFRQRHAV